MGSKKGWTFHRHLEKLEADPVLRACFECAKPKCIWVPSDGPHCRFMVKWAQEHGLKAIIPRKRNPKYIAKFKDGKRIL